MPDRGTFAGPELAHAALGWMLRTFRACGDSAERDKMVGHQIGRVIRAGGYRAPSFCEMVALERERPGREGDLVEAINACEEGLRQRPSEITASAWAALARRRTCYGHGSPGLSGGTEVRHPPGPCACRSEHLASCDRRVAGRVRQSCTTASPGRTVSPRTGPPARFWDVPLFGLLLLGLSEAATHDWFSAEVAGSRQVDWHRRDPHRQ